MSFAKRKTIIEENDTVILYLSVSNLHAIDVVQQINNKKGELVENVFQTSYGALKVKNLIGVKYGSKVSLVYLYNCAMFPAELHRNNQILPGGIVQGLGICTATDTRTVDANTAASNSNHLYARYQYDSISIGN